MTGWFSWDSSCVGCFIETRNPPSLYESRWLEFEEPPAVASIIILINFHRILLHTSLARPYRFVIVSRKSRWPRTLITFEFWMRFKIMNLGLSKDINLRFYYLRTNILDVLLEVARNNHVCS